MQRNYLIKTLVLPLLSAIAISLVVGYFFPWQSFFISLAATFTGILITVFYVNLILRKHEEDRWRKVKNRVNERIERMTNLIISSFRSAFNLGINIFDDSYFETNDRIKIRSIVADAAEKVLIPDISTKLNEVNQIEWKKFTGRINSVVQIGDELISLFGNRIEPEIFSLIVEVQNKADSMFALYSLVPESFGTNDEVFLPSDAKTLIAAKQNTRREIVKNSEELLLLAAKLLRSL